MPIITLRSARPSRKKNITNKKYFNDTFEEEGNGKGGVL